MREDHGYANQEENRGRTGGSPRPAAGDAEMPPELIEQLVQGPMSSSGVQDLLLSFQKAVIERAMSAEMSHRLGYKPGEEKPEGQTNELNGAGGKTVLTDKGAVRIDVPRDRDGCF